jgi:DNA mismatch endonuclease (patch repair protein)
LPDIVDAETRSRMMSGIRGKDTKPELLIRRGLHGRGFRYRLHSRSVTGKPDLVLPRYRAAIFVHGCFWHGHDCHLFRLPATRTDFWETKIARNRARDAEVRSSLRDRGWRTLVVWECALKGRTRLDLGNVLDETALWLKGSSGAMEIGGGPA